MGTRPLSESCRNLDLGLRQVGMVQCSEHSPPTNVARGSIPGLGVIYGLSLLLVLVLAPRGFSPGTPVFPSPQKFQFDLDYFQALDHEPLTQETAQALPVLLTLNLI